MKKFLLPAFIIAMILGFVLFVFMICKRLDNSYGAKPQRVPGFNRLVN